MRLFVDCDDTLVLWTWGKALGVPRDQIPIVHDELVAEIRAWAEANPGCLTVWSLGGEVWAKTVAERVFPGLACRTSTRWAKLPAPSEVFIDDDPFDTYRSATIHPSDLAGVRAALLEMLG